MGRWLRLGITAVCVLLTVQFLPRALQGREGDDRAASEVSLAEIEFAAAAEAAQQAAGTPPNIVILFADDLGVDLTDAYDIGPINGRTPNVSDLAAEGMRFERVWTTPVCSPSRGVLLTGRYGHRYDLGEAIGFDVDEGLPDTEQTLAELLGANGYNTAAFGKGHLAGGNLATLDYMRTLLGFDFYYGMPNWDRPKPEHDNYCGTLQENDDREPECVPGRYFPGTIRDRAVDWLQNEAEEPFFMYYGFAEPHSPFQCPPEEEIGPGCDSNEPPRQVMPYKLAMMDKIIGEVLDELPENTYVIFLGDNGTDSDVAREPVMTNRAKGTVFEGGIRVPMVVRGPGVSVGVTPGVAHIVDLLPTIAELGGATPANELDGLSLLPLLANPQANWERLQWTELWDPNGPSDQSITRQVAATDGRMKLLIGPSGQFGLYDLSVDPFETDNLWGLPLSPDQEASRDAIRDYARPIWQEYFIP